MYKKITMRQSELLCAIKDETNHRGFCSLQMACFLLQTTPQAISRMLMNLSAHGLAFRESNGDMRPCK